MSRHTQTLDTHRRGSKPAPANPTQGAKRVEVRHEHKLTVNRDAPADRRLLGVICGEDPDPLIRADNGDLYEVRQSHEQSLAPFIGSEVTFTVVGTRRARDIRFTGWVWTVSRFRRGFDLCDRRRDPSVRPRTAHGTTTEEHGLSVPCDTSRKEHQQ